MTKNKKVVFARIIVLLFFPFFLICMIPWLIKYIFYTISDLTEFIGDLFDKLDTYLGIKFDSFFLWTKK